MYLQQYLKLLMCSVLVCSKSRCLLYVLLVVPMISSRQLRLITPLYVFLILSYFFLLLFHKMLLEDDHCWPSNTLQDVSTVYIRVCK
jgi:hypothetical protein